VLCIVCVCICVVSLSVMCVYYLNMVFVLRIVWVCVLCCIIMFVLCAMVRSLVMDLEDVMLVVRLLFLSPRPCSPIWPVFRICFVCCFKFVLYDCVWSVCVVFVYICMLCVCVFIFGTVRYPLGLAREAHIGIDYEPGYFLCIVCVSYFLCIVCVV